MAASVFTRTEPALLPVLNELREREPIFHTAAFADTPAALHDAVAPEYWEVGASGRRYSRAFILGELYTRLPATADELGWRITDHAVRSLSDAIYLFTYTLHQHDRVTRRSTLWERSPAGWRVLFHQGTVVTAECDDQSPS